MFSYGMLFFPIASAVKGIKLVLSYVHMMSEAGDQGLGHGEGRGNLRVLFY